MKILYIYKYAILGGVTTQLVNRLKYLKDKLEVHFLYIQDHGGTAAFNGYKNIIIEKDTSKIAEYIDSNKFDFVFCIDTMEAYEALKKAKHKPIIISEVHTTTKNFYMLKDLKKTLPMDAFITPSNYLKERIYNELGYSGLKDCYVVENCLDTEMFNCNYSVKDHDKKIIAWVGKLDEHKNWKKFLNVAHEISNLRDDVEFWIVGGYTAPQYVVKDFLDKINELNLLDKVKWYSYIDYNKISVLFNKVSLTGGVYVSTSKNESFGMTAIEAMACKCPLIMPKVGALPEVLDGKLACNLYNYENDNELICKIIHYLDVKKAKDDIINIGYNKVIENYHINVIGEKYINTLKQIKNKLNKE